MSEQVKISGVVITYNEEHNLEACLNSLKLVTDEIIVVDSFSKDDTEAIARAGGANFIQHPFEGHIQQKNFAMEQAAYDHVLSLDADERLSDDAIQAILKVKASGALADAYRFNRLNNYCGKWIRHCGWYPDRKLRLWNRKKGKWGGVNPHDSIEMQEGIQVENTSCDIMHYTYKTVAEHVLQMNTFSTIAAEEAYKKGERANILVHMFLYPFWVFFKTYFLRLGFMDGFYGFVICINGAYYRFLKYAKLRGKKMKTPLT